MKTALGPVQAPISKPPPPLTAKCQVDIPIVECSVAQRRQTVGNSPRFFISSGLQPSPAEHLFEQLYPGDTGQVVVTSTCLAEGRITANLTGRLGTTARLFNWALAQCVQPSTGKGSNGGYSGVVDIFQMPLQWMRFLAWCTSLPHFAWKEHWCLGRGISPASNRRSSPIRTAGDRPDEPSIGP